MSTTIRRQGKPLSLDSIIIAKGGHKSREQGVCLLEAVAWMAGEKHSDHPACVCPVIASFGRNWNDGINDDETRTRLLKPLIPPMVDTKSTPEVELQRSYLALDWLVRVQVPTWLNLTEKLKEHAVRLQELPEIRDAKGFQLAVDPIHAAGAAARDAARAAVRAAVRAAARDAARDAAGDALKPTVTNLQTVALDLMHRMITIKAA